MTKYEEECQEIADAVGAATAAQAYYEDCYANAQTQQQADAAEAAVQIATKGLAEVWFFWHEQEPNFLSTISIKMYVSH